MIGEQVVAANRVLGRSIIGKHPMSVGGSYDLAVVIGCEEAWTIAERASRNIEPVVSLDRQACNRRLFIEQNRPIVSDTVQVPVVSDFHIARLAGLERRDTGEHPSVHH